MQFLQLYSRRQEGPSSLSAETEKKTPRTVHNRATKWWVMEFKKQNSFKQKSV